MPSVLAPLAILLLALAPAAHAQPSKQCEEIAKNADGMIGPAIVNLNRVEGMGPQITNLKSTAAGDLRPSLDRFDRARQDLAAALRQFIEASRELRDASEACS